MAETTLHKNPSRIEQYYELVTRKGKRGRRKNALKMLRADAENLMKSTKMLFEEKRYKTKSALQEFRDGFNPQLQYTRTFNRHLKQAFQQVDIDENGLIDRAELYAGILLLYHNINMIPWGGRKPPPKRQFVMELFDHYLKIQNTRGGPGAEQLNSLNYDTFVELAREHFSLVVGSVVSRMVIVALVFPAISWYFTESLLSGPLYKFEEPLHSILPSVFMSLMVFIWPYAEAIAIRRLFADKNGFADYTVSPLGIKL